MRARLFPQFLRDEAREGRGMPLLSEASHALPSTTATTPRTSLSGCASQSEGESKSLLPVFSHDEMSSTSFDCPRRRHTTVCARVLTRAAQLLVLTLLGGFVLVSLLLAATGYLNKVAWTYFPHWSSIYRGASQWGTAPSGSWASGRAGLPLHDQGRLTMSQGECRFQFPAFFPQLENNTHIWLQQGGLNYTELLNTSRAIDLKGMSDDWGAAHLVLYRNTLYIRKVRLGGESRVLGLLSLIHQAIVASPEPLPDTEWVVTTADKEGAQGHSAAWVLSKRVNETTDGQWLAPDFGFASWPETGIGGMGDYLQLADAVTKSNPWEGRDDRAMWRGFPNDYPARLDLVERARNDSRSPHPVLNVVPTTFHGDKGLAKPIPMHEHCAQRFLLHTEGNSYSGRNKYLFACRAVVVTHPLNWTQHFHPALIPDEHSPDRNVIMLPGPNFAGVEEALRALQKNDALAQKIADNSHRIMRHRYLVPAATSCYVRSLIRAYASTQNLTTWPARPPMEQNGYRVYPGGVGPYPLPHPGAGLAPAGGRKADHYRLGLKGQDIEYVAWLLSGQPRWPPEAKDHPVVETCTCTTGNITTSATGNITVSDGNSTLPSCGVAPLPDCPLPGGSDEAATANVSASART